MRNVRPALYCIAFILTLLSCSNHPGQVRIRGRFAHLEQGEFFIYSSDIGLDRIDTLHIQEGRFEYMLPLDGEATLHILYPNYSQLALFAAPGEDIKVEGDAQNLSEVKVSGTRCNEIYTQFRREVRELSEKDARALARQYALEYAGEAVARFLFRQYFLLSDSSSHRETQEIYDSLCRARPEDVLLSQLAGAVRHHAMLQPGAMLPDFTLVTLPHPDSKAEPDTIRRKDFRGSHTLFIFWASWKSGSQSAIYRARRLRREMEKELKIVSYSLDFDRQRLEEIVRRDSVDFPNHCDFRCWNSPLVRQWGIQNVPYFILADPDGRIIASGTDWKDDIDAKTQDLLSKK